MLDELISALLQILVFTLIPFLVYLIRYKTTRGFLDYIGVKQTTRKAVYLSLATSILFVIAGLGVATWNDDIRELLLNPPTVTGKFRQMGLTPVSMLTLLIIAWLKTALSEEIFFRGFIGKRLISWLGYQRGNLLQALIFAAIHVLLFWALTKADAGFMVFIFLLSGLAGYVIGYLKEKVGNGSIVPGWIAHGLGNTISYFVIAFLID